MIEPTYTPASMLDVLLDRHQIIAIVVLPGKCAGLDAFPPEVPLRLNLGHTLKPDMLIRTDAPALSFSASFRGVPTRVQVPWAALMFAGTDAALQTLLETDAPPPARGAAMVHEGNVVKVDFAKGRRK